MSGRPWYESHPGRWFSSYRRASGALEYAFADRQSDGTWRLRIRGGNLGPVLATATRRTLADCRRYVARRAAR